MDNTVTSSFTKALKTVLPFESYAIKAYRQLHRIPELGMEESLTYALIVKKLRVLLKHATLPFSIREAKGGIIVDLPGLVEGPFKLFRADIDGLPIDERTNLPFTSKHPGFMHACGHDGHSAMLLAYLRVATSHPDLRPLSPIRLIWQRSEERGPRYSGALKLIEEGVLENVSHVYALHLNSLGQLGDFLSKPGPFLAATGELFIEIGAQGGHVMRQDIYPSALDIATQITLHLNTWRHHLPSPFQECRIIPTVLQTGDAVNIRPSQAKLALAIRHYMEEKEENTLLILIKHEIEKLLSGAPKTRLIRFDFEPGYRPTVNTPSEFTTLYETLNQTSGVCKETNPLYAGEDFGYFLAKRPGCYFQLGAQLGDGVDHHSPYFVIDEAALIKGVAFWLFLSQY